MCKHQYLCTRFLYIKELNVRKIMIDIKERILESREERFQKMQFLKKDFKTVITVKTNIPGDDKNINVAYTLVKLFKDLIPKSFLDRVMFFDSNDIQLSSTTRFYKALDTIKLQGEVP